MDLDEMMKKFEEEDNSKFGAELRKEVFTSAKYSKRANIQMARATYRYKKRVERTMNRFLRNKKPIYITNYSSFSETMSNGYEYKCHGNDVHLVLPKTLFRKNRQKFLFVLSDKSFFGYWFDDATEHHLEVKDYKILHRSCWSNKFEFFVSEEEFTIDNKEQFMLHVKKWFDRFYPELSDRIVYWEERKEGSSL